MSDNKNELFPQVDENGNIIGAITRAQAHDGSKILHPVVHLHVFNTNGDLFLQKRPAWKDIQPNKWDTAVGGHIDFGENTDMALRREAKEELDISDFTPERLGEYVFESSCEKELVYSFKTTYERTITTNEKELESGRFWTMEEISRNLGKDIFTPNFELEFNKLIKCN